MAQVEAWTPCLSLADGLSIVHHVKDLAVHILRL
jgi:hypothetical protein